MNEWMPGFSIYNLGGLTKPHKWMDRWTNEWIVEWMNECLAAATRI